MEPLILVLENQKIPYYPPMRVHPEDAKGIRMRMLESSVCVDSLGELGIDAVSMSFGELFTALQTRVLSFPQVSVSSSTV